MSIARVASTAAVAALSKDQVVQFVTGLLDGLVQDNDFDKIAPCLKDAEGIEVELDAAITDFKKKDLTDIIKGVSELGKIVEGVETDLGDCKGMGPDIERIKVWSAIFKNPIQLFGTVFKNALANIDHLHKDIGNIITDAETQQMHDLGEQIADVLVTSIGPIPKLEEITSYQRNVEGLNKDQITQFVTGLLDGLVQDNDFQKIEPCLKDAEVIEADLDEAITDFKKKDITDIIKGVSVMGRMISTVDTDLQDCSGMGPDIERIKVWSAIFKNPLALFGTVFKNAIANIDKLHTDIGNIIGDAETGQFHDLGEQIADVLVTSIGPIPKINEVSTYQREVQGLSKDQITQFVTGLLDGLVQDNDFQKIEPCLKDAEVIEADLDEAITDFKKKDITDIIAGVSVMGKMISTVDTDLQDCSGMGPDIDRIKAWSAIFKNPLALFRTVFSNALMNIDHLHTDIGNIIQDAEVGKFHDLGEQIADVLVTAIGPIPKIEEVATYNYMGTCREDHRDENSCNADSRCSWCRSAAVASSCNSIADARALPSAVFACSKINDVKSFLM